MEIKHVMLLHIEKTGGTSLRQFLQGTLKKHFKGHAGGIVCNYLSKMPYQCQPAALAGNNATCNKRNADYYAGHIATGAHFRKGCRLTSSHHDYRIIDAIPPAQLATTLLITNFRDPASRLVSHYHMLRRHKDPKALNLSVTEYLTGDVDGRAVGHNRMTRVLAGEFCCKPGGSDPPEYTSAEVYERALAKLDNFCVVGLTKGLQDTFAYIQHVLGARSASSPPPKNLHYHNNAKKYGNVSTEVTSVLERFNEHDTNLYAAASRRFEEQLAAMNRATGTLTADGGGVTAAP